MKKKLISIAFAAAIAVVAAWNFSQSKAEVELSDLALANVDALASGETFGGYVCEFAYVVVCLSNTTIPGWLVGSWIAY
ncbi:MAG: NVEALA domain-containing protein [Tannerellaceae bacterium]|jgi:hypothetical protein|nr:NVEALA domain-containing protein [Tannerellaceae bacterium]